MTLGLQVNGALIPGSQFVQSLVPDVNPTDGDYYSTQISGQVLTYLPAGANLQLTNYSGYSIQLDYSQQYETSASIFIYKIANNVE